MAAMKDEKREREEVKTDTSIAIEEGIMERKIARASSPMTFPTTNDAGPEKNCRNIAVKTMMRMMVMKARWLVVKALRNELERKVAALVDACRFLLLPPFLCLIRRIV